MDKDKIKKDNKKNLYNQAREIYDLIELYKLSKSLIAKELYTMRGEWSPKQSKQQSEKLIVRLRNKIDGAGKLDSDELTDICYIIRGMGEILIKTCNKHLIHAERQRKAEMVLKALSEEEIEKILKRKG